LGGVFLLIEVDGEEEVVRRERNGRSRNEGKEMGYVLHLHEWHCRILEPDLRGLPDEVRETSFCLG
jgi:hypothetical protein